MGYTLCINRTQPLFFYFLATQIIFILLSHKILCSLTVLFVFLLQFSSLFLGSKQLEMCRMFRPWVPAVARRLGCNHLCQCTRSCTEDVRSSSQSLCRGARHLSWLPPQPLRSQSLQASTTLLHGKEKWYAFFSLRTIPFYQNSTSLLKAKPTSSLCVKTTQPCANQAFQLLLHDPFVCQGR